VKRGQFDVQLFIVVAVLLIIGTYMVFNASAPTAYSESGDSLSYLKKQLIMLGIGSVGMLVAIFLNYKVYRKFAWPIFGFGLVLLVAVFTPLGHEVNGARRWLFFGSVTIQSSEFMKIAMVILISYKLSKMNLKLDRIRNYIFYAIVIVAVAVILQLQHHLSATVIIVLPVVVLLLIAGTKLKYFFTILAGGIGMGVLLIAMESFRKARVFAFLDPFNPENIQGQNWQIVNSLMAIGSGGWFGKGLGQSAQKFLLPEPQNDFIFAILVEETGFIGALIVIMLFGYLIFRGFSIAAHAPDKFSSYLAIGITTILATQIIMNILVVTSLMPVTGVSLPFFSYGGTSLIFLMYSMGILLNISRNSDKIVTQAEKE